MSLSDAPHFKRNIFLIQDVRYHQLHKALSALETPMIPTFQTLLSSSWANCSRPPQHYKETGDLSLLGESELDVPTEVLSRLYATRQQTFTTAWRPPSLSSHYRELCSRHVGVPLYPDTLPGDILLSSL